MGSGKSKSGCLKGGESCFNLQCRNLFEQTIGRVGYTEWISLVLDQWFLNFWFMKDYKWSVS